MTWDWSVVCPGNPVSSTNKIDHHDIAEILLKVALNTITPTLTHQPLWVYIRSGYTEAPRNVVPDMQNDLFINHVMSALTTKSTPSENEHHASVMPSFSLFNHNHDHHEHSTIASLTTNSWLHWDKWEEKIPIFFAWIPWN